MTTRAYELRDKACKLYNALEENDSKLIDERKKDFLDFLNHEKTKNYIEGWGKLALGVGEVKVKEGLWKNFVKVTSYKNKVLSNIKSIELVGSYSKLTQILKEDLMMFSQTLAVMDCQEEELQATYAKG